MNRDKITFSPNLPVIVKLDFNPPNEPRPGKFGDQYMYTVNDDAGIMFLDPAAHQLVVATGAKAGDEVAITKAVRTDGGKRFTEWQVARVDDQTEQQPPGAPVAPPPIVSQPRTAAHAASSPATAPSPKANAHPFAPDQLNAPASDPEPAAAAAQARPGAAMPLEKNPLWPALTTAIDAAAAAELHAHRRGLALRFSGEDVRAMALTLYIDAKRGGR
jgi:hypothetical protein